MTPKEELARAMRVCRVVAVIDGLAAFVCAFYGDSHFAFFAVLGGLMWAMAAHIKRKADRIGE